MSRTGYYYQEKKEEIEGVLTNEQIEGMIDEAPEFKERNLVFGR